MFESHISACASDIYDAIASGRYTLDMQVRAYDLLDSLLAFKETGGQIPETDAVRCYCKAYEDHKDRLVALIDEVSLELQAQERILPYVSAVEQARTKAEAAAALHELAKDTFSIWQSSGIFSRQRALHRLRKSAGFRLESHRIGNYVAKTYDLMEEARRAHQKAQQALFSANVAYKCQSGILDRIFSILQ